MFLKLMFFFMYLCVWHACLRAGTQTHTWAQVSFLPNYHRIIYTKAKKKKIPKKTADTCFSVPPPRNFYKSKEH